VGQGGAVSDVEGKAFAALQPVERIEIAVGGKDAGALHHETLDRGAADAAGGGGDERGLAGETAVLRGAHARATIGRHSGPMGSKAL
jgi:hypothetical protein